MHYPIMLWDRNKKYCRTFMFNRKVNNISLMLNLNQACLVSEAMPPLSDRASQAEPRFHLLKSSISISAKTIAQIVFPPCDDA